MSQIDVVHLGDARIHLRERRVTSPRGQHTLSPLEVSLVKFLTDQRGSTVSRDRLLSEIWSYSARSVTRAVDNTVSRLRRKFEVDPANPRWLVSTRGGGYRLELDPTDIPRLLPADQDAFVGREAELGELRRSLEDGARLVSLLGLGGIGKTRTAVRYGWSSFAAHPGGVWFCDLTEVRDAEGIVRAVAGALGLQLGAEPVAQVGDRLASRGRCLLILDNFEQVAAHAEGTLGEWLRRSTELQVVVTSRARLGLAGEVVLELPPLSQDDAEQLFFRRARAADRRFAPVDKDQIAVAELVRVLDCLPLAIELAAARIVVLRPQRLLERVSDRFRLLATGGPGRHATLLATLEWSWELLTADERAALAQLSVFEGGFTVAAAEAVLSIGSLWAVDAVQSLVDKSLVRKTEEDRFGLLVSVQHFAQARLREQGSEVEAELRHGRWFATFGSSQVLDALDGPGGLERLHALDVDLDNLAAASRRASARGDGPVAVATARAAWVVFERKGPRSAGLALLEAALEHPLEPLVLGRLRSGIGWAYRVIGQPDRSLAHYQAALAAFESIGAVREVGLAHTALATVYTELAETDAAELHYERALAAHREVGNRRSEAIALGNLGTLEMETGRLLLAFAHLNGAVAIHREVGNRRSEAIVSTNLGLLAMYQGRMGEACDAFERALVVDREFSERKWEGATHVNLGLCHAAVGRGEEAELHFDAALEIHRDLDDRRAIGQTLTFHGAFHLDMGRIELARRELEEAIALDRSVGNPAVEAAALAGLAGVFQATGRLTEARDQATAAVSRAREARHRRYEGMASVRLADVCRLLGEIEAARLHLRDGEVLLRELDVTELGKLLCVRVALEGAAGDPVAARAAADEAESVARQIGAGPDSPLVRRLRSALADVRDGPG